MSAGFIFIHLFFLGLLFYYQKKEKIYIGYTTVLCLLFLGVVTVAILGELLGTTSPNRLLLLSLWILGSVLIYVTSQLTLAFEKIDKLSQSMAYARLQDDTLKPAIQKTTPPQNAKLDKSDQEPL